MAEENENKRSFLDTLGNVASRVGEGVVDGLAETRPLIGRPLQYGLNAAGFNTEGYQERQDRATLRAAERDARLEILDNADMKASMTKYRDGMRKMLKNYGPFNQLTFDEQEKMLNKKEANGLFELKYGVENAIKIGKGDKDAYNRMGRIFSRIGAKLVDGENGIQYVEFQNGQKYPATGEGVAAVEKLLTDKFMDEMNAHSQISLSSSMGNPLKGSISEYARKLLPYADNSARTALNVLQPIYEKASEKEKAWHMFNRGIKDWHNSNLPMAARMDGLTKCSQFLPQMGYAIEGMDPKNPDPDKVQIIDLENRRKMNFSEFAELADRNDELSRRLNNRLGMAVYASRLREKNKLWNDINAGAANLKSPSAKKTENKTAADGDESPALTEKQIEKLAVSYGDDVHTRNEADIQKLATMDKRINHYAVDVGAIVKNDKGQYVLGSNTAAIRKVAEQFDKFAESFGIKNIVNPWKKKYLPTSVEGDKKSLRQSTVPMYRKNAERIFEQHKDDFSRWGIRDYDAAVRYAEEYANNYGVGLGASSDPDLEKKRKITAALRKAHRNAQRISSHAR